MATIKIFNNKRGNLVAKVQIYAKDIKTGQHKLTSKTLHNDQKLTEAKFRKVRQSDIKNLAKIESLRDLWNNNIFRILLVVIGTNLGVSIATLVILPSQVFIPLFIKLFGG